MKGGPTMLPRFASSVVPRAKIRVNGLQMPSTMSLRVKLVPAGWIAGQLREVDDQRAHVYGSRCTRSKISAQIGGR